MVAGDWHGSSGASDAAIMSAGATGVPLIIQLGDFGLWSGVEGERYLDHMETLARRHRVVVAWIDGNHDNFDLLETYPRDSATGLRPLRDTIWHIPRGGRWTWHGLRFAAVGGATSLDRAQRLVGVSWWPQEALTPAQAHTVCADGPADVMLTHDCPDGVPIPGIDRLSSLRLWPEPDLRAAWAHRELVAAVAAELAPTHLFHGHFHVHYTADSELAPPLRSAVVGLGDHSSGPANRAVVTLDQLAADCAARRAAAGSAHPATSAADHRNR